LFFRFTGVVVLAAAFSFGGASAASAAPNAVPASTVSPNWAGYAVQADSGQAFNFVTASWVEPAMAKPCGSPGTNPSLVTFSTGFDGFADGTQEHAGTALQCAFKPGTPPVFKETAWYETCVGTHCTTVRLFGDFPVQAGDHIIVAVAYANDSFTFVLHNTRTGQTFEATVANTFGATRSSVEAVADVPVPGGGAPLLDFGSITFANFGFHGTGNEEGHSDLVGITMSGPVSAVRAEPGDRHGNHFTVTWKARV